MKNHQENLRNVAKDQKQNTESYDENHSLVAITQSVVEGQTRKTAGEERGDVDDVGVKVQDLGKVEFRIGHDILDVFIVSRGPRIYNADTQCREDNEKNLLGCRVSTYARQMPLLTQTPGRV